MKYLRFSFSIGADKNGVNYSAVWAEIYPEGAKYVDDASLDLSRNVIHREFRSPLPRNRAIMHQCVRDAAWPSGRSVET